MPGGGKPAAGGPPKRVRRVPVLAAAVFLIGASLATCVSAWLSQSAFQDIRQTLERVDAQTDILSLLSDAETGGRGFIITGDDKYLEPYNRSLQLLPGVLAALRTNAAGAPRSIGEFQSVDRLSSRALAEFAATIAAARGGGVEAGAARIRDGGGKKFMDEARAELYGLRNFERTGLASRERRYRLINFALFGSILMAIGGAVLIAAAEMRAGGRHLAELRASENQLSAANSDLEHTVSARTRELAKTLARLDLALRGSHVTVFSLDSALRYEWISHKVFGTDPGLIAGRCNDEFMPAPAAARINAVMRRALASARPLHEEVALETDAGVRWYDLRLEPFQDRAGAATGLLGVSVEITERIERERHIGILLKEVTHRSKNLLAIVLAMSRQTGRFASTFEEFQNSLSNRILSLSKSHELLIDGNWERVPLGALAERQLMPHTDAAADQIEIAGPQIWLRPEAAQTIGMALHELAANALRYGALSTPGGRVCLSWGPAEPGRADEGDVAIEWSERGGPPVTACAARGYGRIVIEEIAARALDAQATLKFERDGVRWSLRLPRRWTAAAENAQ